MKTRKRFTTFFLFFSHPLQHGFKNFGATSAKVTGSMNESQNGFGEVRWTKDGTPCDIHLAFPSPEVGFYKIHEDHAISIK